MARHHHENLAVTVADARAHLADLEAERALALGDGLPALDPYRSALDREIEASRHAYVGAAVTEIATLRAELFGAQVG